MRMGDLREGTVPPGEVGTPEVRTLELESDQSDQACGRVRVPEESYLQTRIIWPKDGRKNDTYRNRRVQIGRTHQG